MKKNEYKGFYSSLLDTAGLYALGPVKTSLGDTPHHCIACTIQETSHVDDIVLFELKEESFTYEDDDRRSGICDGSYLIIEKTVYRTYTYTLVFKNKKTKKVRRVMPLPIQSIGCSDVYYKAEAELSILKDKAAKTMVVVEKEQELTNEFFVSFTYDTDTSTEIKNRD